MTSVRNYKTGLVLVVAFLVATNVQAEMVKSAVDVQALTFTLSGWKDNNAVKQIQNNIGMSVKDAFQFTFTNDVTTGKAVLTFDYSQLVYDGNLVNKVVGDDQGLKFKDFGLVGFTVEGSNIFGSSTGWNNSGWNPTSSDWTYNTGFDWDALVAMVTAEGFTGYITAHMQSIGKGGQSINEGKFTYNPGPAVDNSNNVTPEPATLAILGLGLAGLGMARRRMTK